MSVEFMGMAFKAKVGSMVTKLVLVKLADSCNDEGICWPSIKAIAEQTEMSARSVQRHIATLQEMGLVSVHDRYNQGLQRSNMYRINGAALAQRAYFSGAGKGVSACQGGVTDCQGGVSESPKGVSECHPGGDRVSYRTVREPSRTVKETSPDSDEPGRGELKNEKKEKKYQFVDGDLRFAREMLEAIQQINPTVKEPNFEAWADTIRKMRELDKLSTTDIRNVFHFANQDQFWGQNILSAESLRRNFSKLAGKYIQRGGHIDGPQTGDSRKRAGKIETCRGCRFDGSGWGLCTTGQTSDTPRCPCYAPETAEHAA